MTTTAVETSTRRLVTFKAADLLMGLPIESIQEINRYSETTVVPHAPAWVCGVINLRGDVVTVIDLRKLLGLANTSITPKSRNLVLEWQGQRLALLVDEVSDVVDIDLANILPPPANIRLVDGKMFEGVIQHASQLIVLLELAELLRDF